MKKITLTLTMIILLIFVGNVVLATESPIVSPKVTATTTQVTEGGNLSVTLSVDNITFTSGINSVTLTVEYDSNLFEPLDDTSFDALNNWTAVYAQLSRELTLTRGDGQAFQKEAGEVVKIDFKAKTGTSGQTTTIKLKDMTYWDGFSAKYEAEDIVTPSITIGEVQNIVPVDPIPTPTPDPDPDPTPVPDPNPDKDSPEEIPETGLEDTMKYIILGLFMVAVVFYINYKKLERKNVRYVNVDKA